MEDKVILLDSAGKKVGETFTRRANQLVTQQRAEWTDDSHISIKFVPDAEENWEKDQPAGPRPATPVREETGYIYALAEKRIREKKMFLIHSIALIPVYFFSVLIFLGLFDGENGAVAVMMFLWGVWTTLYAVHAYLFIKVRFNEFKKAERTERRARKIANEMDKLKRMGYGDGK
jgi:hypothetical protein